MASARSIQKFGNELLIINDDGTRAIAYPTSNSLWFVKSLPPSNDGTNPNNPPPALDALYNPWGTNLSDGGDWETHVDRTGRGGADYPFAYGTALLAPGAGTLQSHDTGGTGDSDTGDVGSAGLRSILFLDVPAARKRAPGTNEDPGAMVAVVYQHQSELGTERHYAQKEVVGRSGNSGNGVTHFHVHGLAANGARVDFLKFV